MRSDTGTVGSSSTLDPTGTLSMYGIPARRSRSRTVTRVPGSLGCIANPGLLDYRSSVDTRERVKGGEPRNSGGRGERRNGRLIAEDDPQSLGAYRVYTERFARAIRGRETSNAFGARDVSNVRRQRRQRTTGSARRTARRLATKCWAWLAKGRSGGRGAPLARALPPSALAPGSGQPGRRQPRRSARTACAPTQGGSWLEARGSHSVNQSLSRPAARHEVGSASVVRHCALRPRGTAHV